MTVPDVCPSDLCMLPGSRFPCTSSSPVPLPVLPASATVHPSAPQGSADHLQRSHFQGTEKGTMSGLSAGLSTRPHYQHQCFCLVQSSRMLLVPSLSCPVSRRAFVGWHGSVCTFSKGLHTPGIKASLSSCVIMFNPHNHPTK